MNEKRQNIPMADKLVSHLTSRQFIRDEEQLRAGCLEAGFRPETDRFAVMVVQIERWSDLFSTEAQWLEATKHHFFLLTNMLEELLNRENMAVTAEKDYQMVCLVNLRQGWTAFRQSLGQMMEEMQEILETEFNVSVTIAVSQEVRGLASLPEAYEQAREVLWYNTYLERDQQMTFYDDLCDEHLPMIRSDLTVLDKKLIGKLQMQDAGGVKYVLHEIIDREFIQAQPTVKFLRVRLGSICCKILDALEEFKDNMGDSFYYQLNPGPRIVEAANLSELTGNMDELFDALCHRQDREVQEPKPQWVDKMRVYIEDHYTDENLGLTEVSAVFGITPSYATRVFKQYTGLGIYETIQHVRLAAAKSLMNTDRTMKQIAGMVGYTSFLSMNRAFKKYEGTTPSQFRAQ
jgi:YesN/AraC family two-component response regulator